MGAARARPLVRPRAAARPAPRRSPSTATAACGGRRPRRTWSCSTPPARSSPASSSTSTRRCRRDRRPGPGHRGRPRAGGYAGAEASTGTRSYADVARRAARARSSTRTACSLQQTLYAMGQRVLEQRPEVAEVRLALPNKHHFLVDLAPFGLDNPGEVFHAADRPYGLIEGTVLRDDAPPTPDWPGERDGVPATRHVGRGAGREGGAPGRGADRRRHRRDGRAQLRPAPAGRRCST